MNALYEIIECEQGTPEWKKARAGVITSSRFTLARTKVGCLNEQQQTYVNAILAGKKPEEARDIAGYKSIPSAEGIKKAIAGQPVGEYSDAAKNYAFVIAMERISGEPLDEGYNTWQMIRGRELESDCRLRHERDIDTFAEQAGFIRTFDMKFGCSVDSLINEDGGGEYKCFLAPEKVRAIVLEDDWGDVMDQVQGCMWITGRAYWDMCLYCPPLAPAGKDFIRKRVYRDDDYIEALEADMVEFERYVTEVEEALLAPRPDYTDIPAGPECQDVTFDFDNYSINL